MTVAKGPLSRKQQAALEALDREGEACLTLGASFLEGPDPEINYHTARVLVRKGLAKFERGPTGLDGPGEGLWLVAWRA